MKHEIEQCGVCEKVVKINNRHVNSVSHLILTAELYLNNELDKKPRVFANKDEQICRECDKELEDIFNQLKTTLDKLQGSNRPQIKVEYEGKSLREMHPTLTNVHTPTIETEIPSEAVKELSSGFVSKAIALLPFTKK